MGEVGISGKSAPRRRRSAFGPTEWGRRVAAVLGQRRETRTAGTKTRHYTSGDLDTINKASWTYGRFEVRAKLATQANTSQGIWPAFGLRPNDGGNGEIDVMEAIGSGAAGTEWNKTHRTIHHDYVGTQPAQAHTTTMPSGSQPSDGFHTPTRCGGSRG